MPQRSHLAIHTITNKPWSLAQCVDAYTRAGVGGISVWPESYADIGPDEAARILADAPLDVRALVRGGFFVSPDASARDASLAHNKELIEQAAALEADHLVLVVGAHPKVPLPLARDQVQEGIEAILPHAESFHVRLAVEPLHPMYAADRSCICTLADANFLCDRIDHPLCGIAVDVYHTWWDTNLRAQIETIARRGRLFAFHICDWTPPRDLLNDRALMGDGCIDIAGIRAWVEHTGFDSLIEVEIFSDHWWSQDQDDFLQRICDRFETRC